MKKQNAILIKDFFNDKGALRRGDKVKIEECRPYSKNKRFKVLEDKR